MHTTTRSRVNLPLDLSQMFENNTGIIQGDGLSPLLFDVFTDDINDIFDDICEPPTL